MLKSVFEIYRISDIYITIIAFLIYLSNTPPPPPPPFFFKIFQSICATPNFKSWIRPWCWSDGKCGPGKWSAVRRWWNVGCDPGFQRAVWGVVAGNEAVARGVAGSGDTWHRSCKGGEVWLCRSDRWHGCRSPTRTIGWWWSLGAGDPWWQFGATAGAVLAWGRPAPQLSICCRGWCSGWPQQRGETCDLRHGGRLGAGGTISVSADEAAATVAISGAAAATTSGGAGAAATVSVRDFSADTVSATATSSAPTTATTLSGADAADFRAGGATPATSHGVDATTFSARRAVAATIFRVNAASLHIRLTVTTAVGGVDTAGLCAVGAGAVATWDVDATVCSTGGAVAATATAYACSSVAGPASASWWVPGGTS